MSAEEDENAIADVDVDVGENYPVHGIAKKEDPEPLIVFKRTKLGNRSRCPYGCSKVLASRTIDYHRTNGCRMGTEEPFGETTRKRNYCCGVCYQEFVTRAAFFTHLGTDHDVNASVHHLQFESRQIFERFVRWLEMEGGAHFRHKSGSKRRASGKGIFMACNRSGYTGRPVLDPLRNKTGPFRTGYTCTGFIHGTEHNDGKVTIEFCGDHYGHDSRMRLPNVIKQLIAQKQLDGESFPDITNYLRRQFSPFAHENIYAQRVCMVDLEELRTLMVSTTRKWEQNGIPNDCEIWEEELLDKAGISREGVPRLRGADEKSTTELATENNWPRPHVFVAKMKTPDGFVDLPELNKASAQLRHEIGRLTSGNASVKSVEGLTTDTAENPPEETSQEQSSSEEAVIPLPPPVMPITEESSQVLQESHPCQNMDVRPSRPPGKSPVISRANYIANMCNDLAALDRMIRYESAKVNGTCLVAFLTRIRSLRTSYAATLEASNAGLANGAIMKPNHDGKPKNGLLPAEMDDEDIIEDLNEDLQPLSNACEGKGMNFNKSFWN